MAATALLAVASVNHAQTATESPLGFLGFRAGTSRAEVEASVRALRGTLACTPSSRDQRFAECRGTVASGTGPLTLTLSLIHDSAAVIMIRGPMAPVEIDGWYRDLESRYGSARAHTEHGQTMWQWIRGRQMLRLTTRREGAPTMASVSLVDGPLLDGLGPLPPPFRP